MESRVEARRLNQRNVSTLVLADPNARPLDNEPPSPSTRGQLGALWATPNRVAQPDDNNGHHRRRAPQNSYIWDDTTDITCADTTGETACPYSSCRTGLHSDQVRACLTMYDLSSHLSPVAPQSGADSNLMSQSLVSPHGLSRGRRRHQELTPALPRERIYEWSVPRASPRRPSTTDSVRSGGPKRAVSMTRLDQLAQPRRRYLEETLKSNNSLNSEVRCSDGGRPALGKDRQFKSMTMLSGRGRPSSKSNCKPDLYVSVQTKELSRSMVHLSARPPPIAPRQTRASKLRSLTPGMTRSWMSVNDESLSPTRPISSMSTSMDSTEVKRRVKPTVPRKPRPLSIGSPYNVKTKVEDKVEPRESREQKRQSTHPSVPMRQNRGRSSGHTRPLSLVSPDSDSYPPTPKPMPPRKPAHVKAAALARKTNKQPEQTPTLSPEKPISSSNSENVNQNDVKQEVLVNVVENVEDQQQESASPVPSDEPKSCDTPPNPVMSDNTMPSNSTNKKEVSEEEYKIMMAEKRRLAREQAEREAEAERQRIEKERLEEEERIRREEEEHRKFEEEQLRLIEAQKKAEEERLQRAMEENRLREEEENRRKEEEQRLRLEREEKERKAKEEADRARLELEERLKRDEEERLQRKKKLEAIMSRTRKTPTARGQSPSSSPNETPEPPKQTDNQSTNGGLSEKSRDEKNHQNLLKNESLVIIETNGSSGGLKPDLVEDVDRAVLQNRNKDQSNGNHNNNNNHIDQTFSNGQRGDDSLDNSDTSDLLGDSLDQLINFKSYPTSTARVEDVLNSNHKSAEHAITDLLS